VILYRPKAREIPPSEPKNLWQDETNYWSQPQQTDKPHHAHINLNSTGFPFPTRQTHNVTDEMDRRSSHSELLSHQPEISSARDMKQTKTTLNKSGYLGSLVNE
jgi:hypothetical protein